MFHTMGVKVTISLVHGENEVFLRKNLIKFFQRSRLNHSYAFHLEHKWESTDKRSFILEICGALQVAKIVSVLSILWKCGNTFRKNPPAGKRSEAFILSRMTRKSIQRSEKCKLLVYCACHPAILTLYESKFCARWHLRCQIGNLLPFFGFAVQKSRILCSFKKSFNCLHLQL